MRDYLRTLFRFPYIFILITPVILYGPILFTGKTVFWGTQITQFVPWWTQALEILRAGELPLWNPLNGMGAPLLANYQSVLLYPPIWLIMILAAILGTQVLAWGQALLIMLHLIWAGLGMALLVRKLGWGELSQLVSGLAFGLSGYLVARTHFLSVNFAVAWLPWVMLATYQLVQSKRPRIDMLKLALIFGLQLLAGHAQTTWYTLLLATSWLVFWAWQSGRWAGIKLAGINFLAALFGGIALAAMQLLPTAEYLLQSQRSGLVDFEFAMVYSFWPWRFLTLLAPNLFGSPASGDYWGYAAYWEDAIYLGLLPVFMVFLALFKRGKPDSVKHLVTFLGIVILVSFVFALGENTPLFPWLYHYVPSFDMFQAPTRYSIWALFGLALLAGLGISNWRQPLGRGLYWSRLGVMGAFAVSLGAGLGWLYLSSGNDAFPGIRATFVSAVALAGILGLVVGVLNLTAPKLNNGNISNVWKWSIGLLLSADLLLMGWGLNPATSLRLFTDSPSNALALKEMADGHRIYISAEEEWELKFERFFSFETFELEEDWLNLRAVILPNTNLLDGISIASNFDPLVPERFDRWMEALENVSPKIQLEMLGWMDVGLVQHVDDIEPNGVRFDVVEGAYRARWVPCAVWVITGEEALELILSGDVDASKFVINEAARPLFSECNEELGAEVSIVSNGANRMEIEVEATGEGWLVLADVWYPGWQAKVDGEEVEIIRADYLFRVVELTEGKHLVEFIYRPVPFWFGAAISLLAWMGLLWSWRRWR